MLTSLRPKGTEMADARASRSARREEAREIARRERERAARRGRLLKILVPIVVVVVLVGAGVGVGVAIASSAPAAAPTGAGPANMITGGIQFAGRGGAFTVEKTAGLTRGETPKPVATTNADGTPKIVTYVDFACPGCQAFEAENAAYLHQLVASGKATLEVHPIAILDQHYQTSRYASRANNAGACVADLDPDRFYDVMTQMYAKQPQEGSAGLTNAQIVDVVHGAGVTDPKVDACIRGETFKAFVAGRTAAAGNDPTLRNPADGGFYTPTVLVDGKYYTGRTDDFQKYVDALL
jgi:protein-disulfide isomerase